MEYLTKNRFMSQVKVIFFYAMIIFDLWSVFARERVEYLVFTLLNGEEKSCGYSVFQVTIGHDVSLHYATLYIYVDWYLKMYQDMFFALM